MSLILKRFVFIGLMILLSAFINIGFTQDAAPKKSLLSKILSKNPQVEEVKAVQAKPANSPQKNNLTPLPTSKPIVVSQDKVAANTANKTKSVGWIKASIDQTNSALENANAAKSARMFKNSATENPNATNQNARLLKQYSYDNELDMNPTEEFSLTPPNILDFAEINKNLIDRKSVKRNKSAGLMAGYFKKKKATFKKGATMFFDLYTGYTANFAESINAIQRFNDTPLVINFNNLSTDMIPLGISFGFLTSSKRYAFGLSLTSNLTNNVTFTRQYPDTVRYSNQLYIYSIGLKPKINFYTFSLDMTYFFHQYIISGRDLYKLYAKIGLDAHFLSYSDKIKLTTSNVVVAQVLDNGQTQSYLTETVNYFQEFQRSYDPVLLYGAHFGLGATARIIKELTTFLETKYLFAIPSTNEIKAASLQNQSQKVYTDIPWMKTPTTVRLGYSHLFNLNVGLRFVF